MRYIVDRLNRSETFTAMYICEAHYDEYYPRNQGIVRDGSSYIIFEVQVQDGQHRCPYCSEKHKKEQVDKYFKSLDKPFVMREIRK